MTTKKFIIKQIILIIVFLIVSVIVSTILDSPVITNELAMTQIENSNELYMLWEGYNNLRPVVEVIYGVFSVLIFGSICFETVKFIKTKIEENNSNEKVF